MVRELEKLSTEYLENLVSERKHRISTVSDLVKNLIDEKGKMTENAYEDNCVYAAKILHFGEFDLAWLVCKEYDDAKVVVKSKKEIFFRVRYKQGSEDYEVIDFKEEEDWQQRLEASVLRKEEIFKQIDKEEKIQREKEKEQIEERRKRKLLLEIARKLKLEDAIK